jgi:toxin-antitoxin system PIN domain toxin
MFVVDTNVLVYAANQDAPQHRACRSLVERWCLRREPWFLTWGICYEFMRIVTHPRVLEHPWESDAAWRYLEGLLASPGLSVLSETERHRAFVSAVIEDSPALRGGLFHDGHTAILMREHGIRRIVTNDSDFHRFGFVEVIDPLSGAIPA